MSFRYGVQSKCSNCGKPVSKEAEKCPHCGVHFSGKRWVGKKKKFDIRDFESWSLKHYLALVVILAIVAVCAFALFMPSEDSVSEINHVNELSIAVGEGDEGLSSVVAYGYDKDKGVTTEFDKIYGNEVIIVLRDNGRELNQSDIDKVISGVLKRDGSLVKINDTTIGGKFNNYTYVVSNDS